MVTYVSFLIAFHLVAFGAALKKDDDAYFIVGAMIIHAPLWGRVLGVW
jgi:hypothetical protein